jgi:Na+-transporting methylmalonyl-CoA/oxaloacetate decarboxylase gamma subunit
MNDLVNISIGNAAQVALLGYLVVFMGLVMLMVVIMIMGKIMTAKARKTQPAPAAAAPVPEFAPKPVAPGTAGELKLHDTDPSDAAMIMAIVADTLGKPLNELRFISIKEVKEDEV